MTKGKSSTRQREKAQDILGPDKDLHLDEHNPLEAMMRVAAYMLAMERVAAVHTCAVAMPE